MSCCIFLPVAVLWNRLFPSKKTNSYCSPQQYIRIDNDLDGYRRVKQTRDNAAVLAGHMRYGSTSITSTHTTKSKTTSETRYHTTTISGYLQQQQEKQQQKIQKQQQNIKFNNLSLVVSRNSTQTNCQNQSSICTQARTDSKLYTPQHCRQCDQSSDKPNGLCSQCSRLFANCLYDKKYTEADIRKRLMNQKRTIPGLVQDEPHETTKFLHKFTPQAFSAKHELYHMPLSKYFFRRAKTINNSDPTHYSFFTNYVSLRLSEVKRCQSCRSFVHARRQTLMRATEKSGLSIESDNLASFQSLIKLMFSCNETCAISGVKGIWGSGNHKCYDSLYLLSLDHKLSRSQAGSSLASNIQVVLQCLNNAKSGLDNREFNAWFKRFKKKCNQGLLKGI